MHVLELWRFPVKSLQGEQVDEVAVGVGGIDGDRTFAIVDLGTGLVLTARREPRLLFASARFRGVATRPEITLADGSVAADDDALSDWLGRAVAIGAADEVGERTYENPLDVEHDRDWVTFSGAPGAFHDSARTRVSLVSTGTLGAWDRRRFRANVVLDGAGEDELVGTTIAVGDAQLDVRKRIDRCVIVTRAQPGDLARDLDVLRTVNRERDRCLGVGALVARDGTVRVGDAVGPR